MGDRCSSPDRYDLSNQRPEPHQVSNPDWHTMILHGSTCDRTAEEIRPRAGREQPQPAGGLVITAESIRISSTVSADSNAKTVWREKNRITITSNDHHRRSSHPEIEASENCHNRGRSRTPTPRARRAIMIARDFSMIVIIDITHLHPQ